MVAAPAVTVLAARIAPVAALVPSPVIARPFRAVLASHDRSLVGVRGRREAQGAEERRGAEHEGSQGATDGSSQDMWVHDGSSAG
jgi:hypothetical protein